MRCILKQKSNVIQFPTKNSQTNTTSSSHNEEVGQDSVPLSNSEHPINIYLSHKEKYGNVFLQVEMEDGSCWNVPVLKIADNRAKHYSDLMTTNDLSLYVHEMTVTLEDEEILIDWAEGNMDWKDVEGYAKQVRAPSSTDYQEGWLNGMKDIVSYENKDTAKT